MNRITFGFLSLLTAILMLASCGKPKGLGNVTLKTAAISNAAARGAVRFATTPPALSELKVCAVRLKLESDDNQVENDETGQIPNQDGELKVALGFLDLSDGAAHDLSSVKIPVGFKLSKLTIKVAKDTTLCPTFPHAMSFNGIASDLEMKFEFDFNPAVDLSDGKAMQISFDKFVSSLRTAAANGTISGDGSHEKETIEGTHGDGADAN